MDRKVLRDLLKYISYNAELQIMVTKLDSGLREYEYMFGSCDYVDRTTIERCYPFLLDFEVVDGCHGEGIRDGIYIHLLDSRQ